ncbi:MAG: hypothetical protein HYU63_03400 [Armatimonadetes bacterium]|nr:hypothetical protein [Armatimonadota bacterium]
MLDFKLAEDLINLALKEADDAEIYLEDSNSSEISIHQGKIENLTFHQDKGIGIRVFKDGRMGFASSNDFNLNSLKNLIKSLAKNTKLHTFDEFNGLPENKIKTWNASLYLYDEKIKQENLNTKIKRALEIESSALSYDSRIKGIMKLCYIDNAREYILINSKGLKFNARETRIMSYIWVIAGAKKDTQYRL